MGRKFRVLVSGATGMVGSALVDSLSAPKALNSFRPEVVRLVRHTPSGPGEIEWNPYEMRVDLPALENFDAVVHLAGESGDVTTLRGALPGLPAAQGRPLGRPTGPSSACWADGLTGSGT